MKFERNFGGGPILSGENRKILVSASGARRVILIMPRHLYSGVLDRYVAIKKLFLALLNTSAAREGGWVRSTWPNGRSGYRRRRVLVVY